MDLFDNCPLGELWDRPEPAARPANPPPDPPRRRVVIDTTGCLHCGKPAAEMFCSAKCRREFTRAGERFARRMAETVLADDQSAELL